MIRYTTSLGILLLFVGSLTAAEKGPKSAKAELRNAQGQKVGSASFKQALDGVNISLKVFSLPPGTHAFHIHTVGKCELPTLKQLVGTSIPRT